MATADAEVEEHLVLLQQKSEQVGRAPHSTESVCGTQQCRLQQLTCSFTESQNCNIQGCL